MPREKKHVFFSQKKYLSPKKWVKMFHILQSPVHVLHVSVNLNFAGWKPPKGSFLVGKSGKFQGNLPVGELL